MIDRWGWAAVCCALALGVGAGSLRAEEKVRGKDSDEHRQHMLDRIKDKLGLSDDQAKKMQAAFEGLRKADEPVRKDLKVNLEKLRWQVDAGASADELSATLAAVDKDRGSLRSSREKLNNEFASILTPEQRAKMALAMAKRMRGMRRGRMAGRRAPPPWAHGPRGGHHDGRPKGGDDDDGDGGGE